LDLGLFWFAGDFISLIFCEGFFPAVSCDRGGFDGILEASLPEALFGVFDFDEQLTSGAAHG
jgi:hypothetical protein